MYQQQINERIQNLVLGKRKALPSGELAFYTRLQVNAPALHELFTTLYGRSDEAGKQFEALIKTVMNAYEQRADALRKRDDEKNGRAPWYISNSLCGMSLYVDRFAGDLQGMHKRLDYLQQLGVNLLHLMPVFESPANESDGGYAVSDFRKVDKRFGNLTQLKELIERMHADGMHLMLDIVLNHTSNQHKWAKEAMRGSKKYSNYYYFFPDRHLPDRFEETMPDIFPESAPGSFTWVPETEQWVMTVFHNYQWDLNYANPEVLVSMLDNVFFYANLGVDVLRIDAPAFIWKQLGTSCQNLHEAHLLLRIIRLCVEVAAPGMALLGEAIVAPEDIMRYFGTPPFSGRECHFAYNATQMALQWDALATGDTRTMLAEQHQLHAKPYGASWITYTRCHDDIGLGFGDGAIRAAGYEPYTHRSFLKEYYSGKHAYSVARGALFAVNPRTGDARISGTLASLCGLETALEQNDNAAIDLAVRRIVLMQAHSMLLGGLPMLFYGDERAAINDYTYRLYPEKAYDNRWMHRPLIDWDDTQWADAETPAGKVFSATQQLIALRKSMDALADRSNVEWFTPHNIHVAGFLRYTDERNIYCVLNYSNRDAYLTWYAFKEKGLKAGNVVDHVSGKEYSVGSDREYLVLPAYGVMVLEAKND